MGRGRSPANRLARGSILLVPFPFTDLSGTKRRPALVVSPDGFDPQDVILCAISSQSATNVGPWAVQLVASDVVDAVLPRPSVILIGKLFTMHRAIVAGRFGRVTAVKMVEVLAELTRLFSSQSEAFANRI